MPKNTQYIDTKLIDDHENFGQEESLLLGPDSHSNLSFMADKISVKKKTKKSRFDPVTERRVQNYQCYKEYCKLKTIHDLIQKELKQIQADGERYENTLEMMKENKARHEDELGYYLGIGKSYSKFILSNIEKSQLNTYYTGHKLAY